MAMSDNSKSPEGFSNEDRIKFDRVHAKLLAEFGKDKYDSWFASLELDRLEPYAAHLTVPTKFLKSWVQTHYFEHIKKHVVAEFVDVQRLTIETRSPAPKTKARSLGADRGAGDVGSVARQLPLVTPLAPRDDASPSSHAPAARPRAGKTPVRQGSDTMHGSPLDRRLTFASFVGGPSNQFALAAAKRVVEQSALDGPPLFNPLYAHAAVGLGKTHLLQAMAHAATDNRRRVLYFTAEKFMSAFVAALREQSALTFKEALRAIDLLIVDDIQFLQGAVVQAEFCHLLNALIDAGRQVVVAADRAPAQLDSLDERVLSRLKGGLCVDIAPLDEPLRAQIIEARIAAAKEKHPAFSVPPEVVFYVAKTVASNGRDLDGAVNRLLALSTLNGAPISVASAERAIRDLVNTSEPKRVKIDDIQKLVATHYNVSRADLLSARRNADVVLPRQIAMYLSKILTPRSLPEIGRRFGNRDHTTVIHAVRKIEGLVARDNSLAESLEVLKRILSES
jgi:chromosomal replication initiator protein